MSANSADGGNLFTALNHLIHNSTPRLLTVQRGKDFFYIESLDTLNWNSIMSSANSTEVGEPFTPLSHVILYNWNSKTSANSVAGGGERAY